MLQGGNAMTFLDTSSFVSQGEARTLKETSYHTDHYYIITKGMHNPDPSHSQKAQMTIIRSRISANPTRCGSTYIITFQSVGS